jgi:peptide-methionine (S)-S-oxide reductase
MRTNTTIRIAAVVLSLAVPAIVATMAAANRDRPEQSAPPGHQQAVFAGGCFWGVEAVFERLNGVSGAVSGYAGGRKADASYEAVSGGGTGHAESVQVTFDPAVISYRRLLEVFFSVVHDPTQLNRQGPDEGPQYRSAIFYSDETQQRAAQAYIGELTLAKTFEDPIVTTVVPLEAFYAAEPYHQNFLVRNPRHPYIVFHDLPKLQALEQRFPGLVKKTGS